MSDRFEALLSVIPLPGESIDWQAISALGFAPYFSDMEKTMQNPEYHAEGDVLTHTRMVCEAMVNERRYRESDAYDRAVLFLGALMHDLGKPKCTKLEDGVLRSRYHASRGAVMARRLLWHDFGMCGTRARQAMREEICALIRYHSFPPFAMHSDNAEYRMARIASCGELAGSFNMEKLCLLERADILGRTAPDTEAALERIAYCELLAEEIGCKYGPYPFANPHSQRAYFLKKTEWRDIDLFRDTWGEVILMSGLPGTGKDTWIRNHIPDIPMVSLDAIREKLHISPTDKQAPVVAAAQEEAREYLRKKQPFVWNATCISIEIRAKQIELFEQYGASVRTHFLETEWHEQLRRNEGRAAVVPTPVIEKMLSRLEIPERHECETVTWETV